MLLNQRRFVNSKLKGILELYRKHTKETLSVDENTAYEILKYKSKKSIAKLINTRLENKDVKSYEDYSKKHEELDKKADNNEITQEEYDKEIDKIEYKYNKTQYILNNINEKPKNPLFERAKQTMKNAWNGTKNFVANMGKGIGKFFTKTVPLALGTGAKTGFKTMYKGTKHVIKGAKTIGKGMRFVGNKVGELTKDIREEANQEMRIKEASKQQANAIKNNNPRKNLGMQHVEIDHKEAAEKAIEEATLEKEPQELENN